MNRLRMLVVIFRSNMIIRSRNNDLSKMTACGVVMVVAAAITLICVNYSRM